MEKTSEEDGYIAVSEISWLTDTRPGKLSSFEKFLNSRDCK
ncbi:MAG: hypothetical protein AAGU14_11850 [Eubacteriaceae bacterium]